VAGIAVLGTLGLLLGALRLRQAAGHRRGGADPAARRH
jgi:hypothetical protein